MRWRIAIGALLATMASADVCLAADPRYPDWPCAQAKVPEISLAAVWAGPPLDDIKDKWKDDAKVSALVSKLAARKLAARRSPEGDHGISDRCRGRQGHARASCCSPACSIRLNAQRSSVMNGLERVMRKQREAADKIRADTLALQALQDAPPPDQAKVDELGNQLVWETRIFEDRRRVVKFVCEVPTAIDQRLFALGRTIQQEME